MRSSSTVRLLTQVKNWIKVQAHDHPKFRTVAARYGQTMHQVNMRMAVTLLRDAAAERRAKEKAEAPTVKTEEQTRHDEAQKEKNAARAKAEKKEASKSIWRRKFRPLPEEKAVDLFADVIGDSFILIIASGLILYEYIRAKGKPDIQAEKIAELNEKLQELEQRGSELEEAEKERQKRVENLETVLGEMRKTTGKKRLLSSS